MTRPSLKAFWQNFDRADGSIQEKLAKAFANHLRKVTALSECCGHHGEPGC